MKRLTKQFQLLNPSNIYFGDKTIHCNCDRLWIQEWLDLYKHECPTWNSSLICEMSKGQVSLKDLTDFIDCSEKNTLSQTLSIIFSTVIFALIITISTAYIYKYEIRILFRKYKKPIFDKFKYDAFVPLHFGNAELRLWTTRVLLSELRKAGYVTYCSFLDAELGSPVEEEVIRKIAESRNFLIIISQQYVNNLTTDDMDYTTVRLEWRHIWNVYKQYRDRSIVIINFDQLRTNDVKTRPLQAFLRLNRVLDFSNRNHSLIRDIKKRIGVPGRQFKLGCPKPKSFSIDCSLSNVSQTHPEVSDVMQMKEINRRAKLYAV